MERMTTESQRKRLVNQLGSEDAADRAMFAEEQREKARVQDAQLAADRDRDLQKRIAQKRAEIQRDFEIAPASATGVVQFYPSNSQLQAFGVDPENPLR